MNKIVSEENMREEIVVPKCIGIIMDGNRRWAKARGLSPWEGHTEGYKKLRELVRWGKEQGIQNVIVYAFSTENWKRPTEEVEHILALFRHVLMNEIDELAKEEVRIRFVGERGSFPDDIQELMVRVEERTASFTGHTMAVAASYGGRAEILAAIEVLRMNDTPITEASFSTAVWTGELPDPDLIIRTGGEMRLSNFLLWQSAYSELFFSKTEWPDFSEGEFKNILAEYTSRKRNFGA